MRQRAGTCSEAKQAISRLLVQHKKATTAGTDRHDSPRALTLVDILMSMCSSMLPLMKH